MITWLVSAWASIWPNLLADVLWVPAVGVFHLLLRRRLTRHLTGLHHEHAARIERAITSTQESK